MLSSLVKRKYVSSNKSVLGSVFGVLRNINHTSMTIGELNMSKPSLQRKWWPELQIYMLHAARNQRYSTLDAPHYQTPKLLNSEM